MTACYIESLALIANVKYCLVLSSSYWDESIDLLKLHSNLRRSYVIIGVARIFSEVHFFLKKLTTFL